jgi:probable phosphoglycerate mutase
MEIGTTELVVVRHGETAWNADGRIQGHQVVPLNERGRDQAVLLGKRLASEKVEAIYSSDLLRTMETAEAISQVVQLEILKEAGLREWSLGVLEGRRPEDSRSDYPDVVEAYERRDPDGEIPGGETIRDRYARTTSCLRRIARDEAGRCVVVVSHGGVLDDLYRMVNEIPLEKERDFDLYNGGIHRFDVTDDQWTMTVWGDIEHLKDVGSLADW